MNVQHGIWLAVFSSGFASLPLAAQSRMQMAPATAEGPKPVVGLSAQPGAQQSVNSIAAQVQVTGAYATSAAAPDAEGGPLRLTVEEAIARGLRYNLGAYAAAARKASAEGTVTAMRSALLPSISGALSETVDKVNLASEGFDASNLPSIGSYFPSVIGPFHLYTAQGQVSYSAFDMVAVRNLLAAKQSGKAAAMNERDAREQIVLAVAATYLEVLVQQVRVESAASQLKYARAVYEQAVAQKEAGARSAIEVNRSRVQMLTREQQLLAQQGELKKQKMRLARLVGLSADREIELADPLATSAGELPQLEALYTKALRRPDLEAAKAELASAEQSRHAAAAEWLPSVRISGNIGEQGADFHSGRLVYQGTASLNVPLFNGGATRSDIQQADAVVEQRRASLSARIADTHYEIRAAWVDEEAAAKELVVAAENRLLARQTLEQTIDRFKVGASDSVEVAQSEDMAAAAEQDYISVLFALRLAQMSLARAAGTAEKDIPGIVKGVRPE